MSYSSEGFLMVRVYAAREALPIKNAVVHLRGGEEENLDVQYTIITDEDGITPRIALPAPDRNNSLAPNSKNAVYAKYDVLINAEGYYSKHIYGVAIFAGVESTLPVFLLPVVSREMGGLYPRGNNNVIIPENDLL